MIDDTMPFLDTLLKRGGGGFLKKLAEDVLGRLRLSRFRYCWRMRGVRLVLP